MIIFMRSLLVLFFSIATIAGAQQSATSSDWVQIEAHSTRAEATTRAEFYAQRFDNVAGFALGNGWHGIALGPFNRATAEAELLRLRRQGVIPSDSFVANGTSYRDAFFPTAGSIQRAVAPTPDPAVQIIQQQASDETVAQARASERELDRNAKRLLQTALAWAGSYSGAIDGLYGRGTRRAMRDWQTRNGFEDTGILTTKQRQVLLSAYNAVLVGMDLKLVADNRAGVSVLIPTGVVGDATYDAPFARYDATGDMDAKLIVISQRGDETRMRALYDIIQTLAIIPKEGDRRVRRDGFTIEGVDSKRHTQVLVNRNRGEIKGIVLVWPVGDEERRSRVWQEVSASFQSIDGVLEDASILDDDAPQIDLLAGLEVRKPRYTQSGLFLNDQGLILTAQTGLGACGRIEVAQEEDATILASNDHLTILKPKKRLAPSGNPTFQTAALRAPSEIAVGGFSYGGLLGAPTMTLGRLQDLKDLTGNTGIARLDVTTQAGDVGGPIYDRGGAVIGVLLPQNGNAGQTLPENVQFAALPALLRDVFQQVGFAPQETTLLAHMDPIDLSAHARDTAALVTCWD